MIVVGLNYHRIGERDPDNPFHRLHTVAEEIFRAQIALARARGPFVSLDDIVAGRLSADVSFLLTFDDASASIEAVRSWLLEQRMPFHVCPAVEITANGFWIRDKVYWIIARLDRTEIAEAVTAALGPSAAKEDFYYLTKAPNRQPEEVERVLIEPLFARAAAPGEPRAGAYLSWNDYRRRYAGEAGIGLVSHGTTHRRMEMMDEIALNREITDAEKAFLAELDVVPRDFAVPFGEFDAGLAHRLDSVLTRRGYRTVLWVDSRAKRLSGRVSPRLPIHIPRLRAPETIAGFANVLDRAIAAAGPFWPDPSHPAAGRP